MTAPEDPAAAARRVQVWEPAEAAARTGWAWWRMWARLGIVASHEAAAWWWERDR